MSRINKSNLAQLENKVEADKELILSKLDEREKLLNQKIKHFWFIITLCVGFGFILSGLTYKNLQKSFEKKFSDKLEKDLSKLFSEKTNIDRFNAELSKISSTNAELELKVDETSIALDRAKQLEESLVKTSIVTRVQSLENSLDDIRIKVGTLRNTKSFVIKRSLPSSEDHSKFFYNNESRSALDFTLSKNQIYFINYTILFYSNLQGDPLAGYILKPVIKLNEEGSFVSNLGTCKFLPKTEIGGFGRDDVSMNQCFGTYFVNGSECEKECKVSAGMVRDSYPVLNSSFSKINVVATVTSIQLE